MAKIFLFNPQNDGALAFGEPNYTPPRQAAEIARCGAELPWWLGEEGDLVFVPLLDPKGESLRQRWLSEVEERFGRGPRLVTSLKGLTPADGFEFQPWGWSYNAVRLFQQAGASLPPDQERLAKLRQLSHRRSSIAIIKRLRTSPLTNEILAEAPQEAFSLPEIEKFLADHQGQAFVKAPWSSSGRGVFATEGISPKETLRRCEGIIHRQGSVMLEARYDKVEDFAMLFTAHQGRVSFSAYSLFATAGRGAYVGNLLLSDSQIERRLGHYVPMAPLRLLQEALQATLTSLLGDVYSGPLGIDMMIVLTPEGHRVVPCVELNLRTTMGTVAASLRRHGLVGENLMMAVAPFNPCLSPLQHLVPPCRPFQFAEVSLPLHQL